MVLLTVDTIVFFNFVFYISSTTYLKYLILSSYLYGGGRPCTLLFSNCLKLEQIHWQYSCFALSYNHGFSCYLPGVFLVKNHSCKIDFSSLHFIIAPKFCTLYSCILFQIKWKEKNLVHLSLYELSCQSNRFRV